jgi:hypothetical protein
MTDHNELVSLVPEKSSSNSTIDACKCCLGYPKTFTTLQGGPPVRILLDDLTTAHLDVAALERGYNGRKARLLSRYYLDGKRRNVTFVCLK